MDWRTVPGWLSPPEAEALARYAKAPWCEVGTYCGKSAVVLAQSGPGFVVDTFCNEGRDTHADFLHFTAGLPITVLKGDLRDMASQVPNKLEVLHLDADHSFDATKAAFRLYAHKLKVGGILFLHDANPFEGQDAWPGVTQFAKQLDQARSWKRVEDVDRHAIYQRLK